MKPLSHYDAPVKRSDTENIVLQVDFSENATIASQQEVQSVNWLSGKHKLFLQEIGKMLLLFQAPTRFTWYKQLQRN